MQKISGKFAATTVFIALVFFGLGLAHAQDETEFYDNGMALMGQKKYAEAEAQFRQSVKTDPRYKEAWQALADVLRAEGKTAQADAVQKIAEDAPAARAGTPPALTEEQQRVLEGKFTTPSVAPPVPPTPVAPVVALPDTPLKLKTPNNPPKPLNPVNLAPLKAKPGCIIGRVVTESGEMMPSFTIEYSGFEKGKLANYNPNGGLMETVSNHVKGVNGSYEVKVPNGAYRASGYVTYNYKGHTYNFELEPLNSPAKHDYDGLGLDELRGGLVRDFVLKMTAKKTGAAEDTETVYKHAYYGGRVDLNAGEYEAILGGGNTPSTPLRSAFPPDSRLEITLTPQGPRVDGSTGQPIIGNLRLGDDGKYTFSMRGLFPGVYTATARLATPDGQIMPLRVSSKPATTVLGGAGGYDKRVMDWKSSVTLDFLPNDLGPMPRMGVNSVTLYLGK